MSRGGFNCCSRILWKDGTGRCQPSEAKRRGEGDTGSACRVVCQALLWYRCLVPSLSFCSLSMLLMPFCCSGPVGQQRFRLSLSCFFLPASHLTYTLPTTAYFTSLWNDGMMNFTFSWFFFGFFSFASAFFMTSLIYIDFWLVSVLSFLLLCFFFPAGFHRSLSTSQPPCCLYSSMFCFSSSHSAGHTCKNIAPYSLPRAMTDSFDVHLGDDGLMTEQMITYLILPCLAHRAT